MSNARIFCIGAVIALGVISLLNIWPGEPPHSLMTKHVFRLLAMFTFGCIAVAWLGDRKRSAP